MKVIAVFIPAVLIAANSFAQIISAKPKHGVPTITIRIPADSSSLKQKEFYSFNYDAYLRQKDSIALVYKEDGFKQRLISIDSLITTQKNYQAEDTWFDFMITYRNGTIDSFIINLTNGLKFNESAKFEQYVSEQNLSHIQYALSHAQYSDVHVGQYLPLQVDYISRQIETIQADAGLNETAYASGLLKFIRQLLTDNKKELGIASNTVYEDAFEPANLSLDKKITMREKFIRYVYTKISS